ncbi:CBS domain-containing protein [Telmatospirillum sp. J64-1]|uniref:CBS domain-containing protein n=1 Tax=Telmatospirillum sp. J64-1 TaxID=2502183 RepID=UPI00115DCA60|nr:CBS domain-containing protein [Telmatospirillum sp. J64-1]
MQVKDVMHSQVEVIGPDLSVYDAARMMRDIDTGFLPVGEGDRLIGTLTDRDITMRSTAEGKDPNQSKVREAMSEKLVYCFEDDDLNEAAALMGEAQIRRLPVLNRDKRLVGVLSLGDVSEHEQRLAGQAEKDVHQDSGQPRSIS